MGGDRGRELGRYCSALAAAGVDLSAVELVTKDSKGGGGRQVAVLCKNDTAAGAAVMSIPLATVITAEALAATVEFADVTAAYACDSGAAVIIAWLMRQRFFPLAGEASDVLHDARERDGVWAAYVGHLPSSFDLVFHWTEAECALLQGTNLFASLPAAKAALHSVYDAVIVDSLSHQFPERWPREEATWERFLWAHSAYISRGFPIDILTHSGAGAHAHDGAVVTDLFSKSRAGAPCLLPLIDSCDHDQSARVTWQLSESKQTVSLVFDEALAKGQSVLNNYGAKFDEDLLLCYGCALPLHDCSLLLILSTTPLLLFISVSSLPRLFSWLHLHSH